MGRLLDKAQQNTKRKIVHYVLQSVQPNMRRRDTLNPKETQGANNPQIVIEDQNTHKRNT